MADFQPFSLGQVLQTAEAVKASRQQSITERLQQQYLGKQIERADADADWQRQQRETLLGKEKAQQLYDSASYVLGSTAPKTFVEQNYPNFIRDLQQKGVQWETLDDDGVRQMAQGLQAKAGAEIGKGPAAPLSSQGKLLADQRAGYLTKEQVDAANASKRPQSYEEYVLSQKDPEFRRFLANRKGKGLSVTLPDGTVVEMGGNDGAIRPGELSKPTINNLQETIVNSSNRLDRLNQLMTTYKPDYLRAKGLLKAGTSEVKDFLGIDLSPEEKQQLRGYSEFQASSSQEFSATLKELSGTAATEGEVARVIKGVPSAQDKSPEVFEAKALATTKFITRAIMRANWALKNGIGIKSVDELSKRMPLEGIDGVYESRANQIWQEMGGTPETRQRAMQQANQEFGVARE